MSTPFDRAAARARLHARMAEPDTRTAAERAADSAWDRSFCNAALAALAPVFRRMEEQEMSYCRFCEDSDVYLYATASGQIVCCMCSLLENNYGDTILDGPAEALAHLETHSAAGDRVPERASERLREEEKKP